MRNLAALLLLLSLWQSVGAEPLHGVTVVLDPGHGDRAWGEDVPADPGATVDSPQGIVNECVFTWDTAMRLRERLLESGAAVELTLEDPEGEYRPQPWDARNFPKSKDFRFKILVDKPEPKSIRDSLVSRVATANRVYFKKEPAPVYFISLHFDSTAPSVGGIKFYYPAWKGAGSGFVKALEKTVRRAKNPRVDLDSGQEIGLSEPGDYAVLHRSLNPDSYLIELGNIRSHDAKGGNPDLRRMRDPKVRDEYAALITDAIVSHEQALAERRPRAPKPAPPPPRREQPQRPVRRDDARTVPLLAVTLVVAAVVYARRRMRRRRGEL